MIRPQTTFKIDEVMLDTIPERKADNKSIYPVWFTRDVIKMIKEKEKCRQKLKKTKNPQLWEKYSELRAKSKKLIPVSYRRHVRDRRENEIQTLEFLGTS